MALILTLIILLNICLPSVSFAARELDYRILIIENIGDFGKYETPLSNFQVYKNGSSFGRTSVGKGTNYVGRISELGGDNLVAKVVDKITISDLSTLCSGSRVLYHDLQVGYYKESNSGNQADDINSYSNLNTTITLDKAGYYVIFLNTADNYSKIPNYNNASQYGNFRTTGQSQGLIHQ